MLRSACSWQAIRGARQRSRSSAQSALAIELQAWLLWPRSSKTCEADSGIIISRIIVHYESLRPLGALRVLRCRPFLLRVGSPPLQL